MDNKTKSFDELKDDNLEWEIRAKNKIALAILELEELEKLSPNELLERLESRK